MLVPALDPLRSAGSPSARLPLVARRAPSVRLSRRRELQKVLEQHPLCWRSWTPGAALERPRVFAGVGLCSLDGVSRDVPFDLLGLLLPAEAVRRAVDAPELTVLLADAHALAVGMPERDVAEQVKRLTRALEGLRRLPALSHLDIVLASQLHRGAAWRAAHRRVVAALPPDSSPYLAQQLADVSCLRAGRSLVKVGWALADEGHSDERAFDDAFRAYVGEDVSFVYTRPGRCVHPRRFLAVPYVTTDPSARLCLRPDEAVGRKWRDTDDFHHAVGGGVRRRLKAITRSFSQDVQRLRGPMPERLQQVVDAVFPPPRALLEVCR